MKVATADIIRELDRRAMDEYGISGPVLMENAGGGMARVLMKKYPFALQRGVTIISGRGNNGGDGFVIARHLVNRGIEVDVFIAGEMHNVREGETKTNLDIIRKMGLGILEITRDEDMLALVGSIRERGLLVDALLGTGIKREVTGQYSRIIDAINDDATTIVSVDIPSGLSADTGNVMGRAVKADLTCAFGLPKVGEIIYPGAEFVGELLVIDISIPRKLIDGMDIPYNLISPELFSNLFRKRAPVSHKGSFGHLLVIAGSPGKTGAAALSALGAMRSGVGLTTVGVPESLNHILEAKLTEAMTLPLPDEGGHLSTNAFESIMVETQGKSAIALGPGLGTSRGAREVVRGLISESRTPVVIDADGLNVIACDIEIIKDRKTDIIITPHPGEMGRIINKSARDVQKDRIGAARGLARGLEVWVVLKGARTIIAAPDGSIYISTAGNPGMASGGMGDVLTGLIGGFLAIGGDPLSAAAAGVFVHGTAGDRAAQSVGEISLTAQDVLDEVPGVISQLYNKELEYPVSSPIGVGGVYKI